MASKYQPLTSYLSDRGEESIEPSFREIEEVIGTSLPASACLYREWWANSGQPQSKIWTTAGYYVERPDLTKAIIRFVKADDRSRQTGRDPSSPGGRHRRDARGVLFGRRT
jgi:hypothetical protein